MTNISLADAKAHLSELVDRVEAEESIDITRRGKPRMPRVRWQSHGARFRPLAPNGGRPCHWQDIAVAFRRIECTSGKTATPPQIPFIVG